MSEVVLVMKNIIEAFQNIQRNITNEILAVSRDPSDIKIVAVSKKFGPEKVIPLLEWGHSHFGENQIQEAESKWEPLKKKYPAVQLHLIGPLQSNKVKRAVALFDVIETIDRIKIAERISSEIISQGKNVNCYIQINTGDEEQKSGVMPEDADAFIDKCKQDLGLPIIGLMCIPPIKQDPTCHFNLLSSIAKKNSLKYLSMGMSQDFKFAIRAGATSVRIGTAIFGEREKPV